MFYEAEFALTPISFFQMECDCKRLPATSAAPCMRLIEKNYKNYLLPNVTSLTDDEDFIEFALGWDLDGLEGFVKIKEPFEKISYPAIEKGDSVEVMVDTRDVKSSGYNTRFCHHFYFLPESIESKQAGEITKFRTEDKHDWCHPGDLLLRTKILKESYSLQFFIPSHCLLGYDPEQFPRIGFTYRVNRCGAPPAHFSASSRDYLVEQQPSLWSTMRLTA